MKTPNSIRARVAGNPWLLALATALLAVGYLLQSASPLRLNTDAIVLLSIGDTVAAGQGSHFPPGYPAMLAGLNLLGVASSAAFILLNCAFVAVTFIAAYHVYRRPLGFSPAGALGLCCLGLLSFVLVKHVTIPLSDVPFMGLFTLALWFAARAGAGPGWEWGWLVLALLTTVAALSVRTAGVVLLPAFVWLLGVRCLPRWVALRRKFPPLIWILPAGCLILGLGFALLISQTRYFAEMKAVYFQTGVADRLLNNLLVHGTEMGEICVNLPAAKAPALLQPAYPLAGLLLAGLILRGVWLRRPLFGVLEVTLLAYMGLIFAWPYFDARFWLPVFPLMIPYVALALGDAARLRFFQCAGPAAKTWFALAGLAALAYSTKISWAGTRFPDVYGNGTLSPTYRAAFLGQTNLVTNGDPLQSDALRLLQRYDSVTRKVAGHGGN